MSIRIATFAALLGLLGIGFATLPKPAQRAAAPVTAKAAVNDDTAVHGLTATSEVRGTTSR